MNMITKFFEDRRLRKQAIDKVLDGYFKHLEEFEDLADQVDKHEVEINDFGYRFDDVTDNTQDAFSKAEEAKDIAESIDDELQSASKAINDLENETTDLNSRLEVFEKGTDIRDVSATSHGE